MGEAQGQGEGKGEEVGLFDTSEELRLCRRSENED